MLKRLSQTFLAERQFLLGPDLGVLNRQHTAHSISYLIGHTGFKVCLILSSRVPALMAMISGAASGSCAMGEPHSEQKMRWLALPEVPFFAKLFCGPRMVSLALGTTATRAVGLVRYMINEGNGKYSKSTRSGAGSRRSGRKRQCRACRRRPCR